MQRKTVKAEDIALAIDSSKALDAPEGEKHNIFDVIKNVFTAVEEGKGIDEVLKSFMKK